jgi:hypothetical protein
MEPIVADDRNWHPVNEAPKGCGPLLLRAGPGPFDPAYVGHQADDGRWLTGDVEVSPTHYCEIPLFDASDDEASS